jgi:hypothetical protein
MIGWEEEKVTKRTFTISSRETRHLGRWRNKPTKQDRRERSQNERREKKRVETFTIGT